MIETAIVIGLTWLVSLYLTYDAGHFNGRRMMRDEFLGPLRPSPRSDAGQDIVTRHENINDGRNL